MQQLNKRFGSQLLISEMVWQEIGEKLAGGNSDG